MLLIAIYSNYWFVVLLPSKHTSSKAAFWGYAHNLLGRKGINIWNKRIVWSQYLLNVSNASDAMYVAAHETSSKQLSQTH